MEHEGIPGGPGTEDGMGAGEVATAPESASPPVSDQTAEPEPPADIPVPGQDDQDEGEGEDEDDERQPVNIDEVPVLTVPEILEKAPSDIREEWVHVPQWGGKVKIRTLTANQRARIREIGLNPGDGRSAWAEMEIQQFLAAVIEPKFTEEQVRELHEHSSDSFAVVTSAHDILSIMNKEEIRETRRSFRGQEE